MSGINACTTMRAIYFVSATSLSVAIKNIFITTFFHHSAANIKGVNLSTPSLSLYPKQRGHSSLIRLCTTVMTVPTVTKVTA